jgi:predicted hotdog family 3-hydroxylacyl-ACP dehydratase
VLIDQSRIRELIPHAGPMCLLDGVQAWDGSSILCVSSSHRLALHPLRRAGRLSAIYGVEYAAQAMALHAALGAAHGRARAGYLIALRDVACGAEELDALPGDLLVRAERMQGDAAAATYRFAIHAAGQELLAGRATVKFA